MSENDRTPSSTGELAAVERREEGRVRVATEVTTKSLSNFTALGTDLSVGGIYIVSPNQIQEGARVDLEFSIEGADSRFEAVGEVKWSKKQPVGEQTWWGHGIEFREMGPEAAEQLEGFVGRRKPLEKLGSIPALEEG